MISKRARRRMAAKNTAYKSHEEQRSLERTLARLRRERRASINYQGTDNGTRRNRV